jgi:hypothetical protein
MCSLFVKRLYLLQPREKVSYCALHITEVLKLYQWTKNKNFYSANIVKMKSKKLEGRCAGIARRQLPLGYCRVSGWNWTLALFFSLVDTKARNNAMATKNCEEEYI